MLVYLLYFLPAALQFATLSVTTCKSLDDPISSMVLIKDFEIKSSFINSKEVVSIHKHSSSTYSQQVHLSAAYVLRYSTHLIQ